MNQPHGQLFMPAHKTAIFGTANIQQYWAVDGGTTDEALIVARRRQSRWWVTIRRMMHVKWHWYVAWVVQVHSVQNTKYLDTSKCNRYFNALLIAFVWTKKVMQFVNKFYVACLHSDVNMRHSGTVITAYMHTEGLPNKSADVKT